MSDDLKPGPTVERPTRHPDDTDTHVWRLNAGDNPADGTGVASDAAPGAPPKPDDESRFGPLRPYRLLANAFVGAVFRKAGEIVELYDHQVGTHHEPVGHDGPLSAQGLPILAPKAPDALAPLLRAGDRVDPVTQDRRPIEDPPSVPSVAPTPLTEAEIEHAREMTEAREAQELAAEPFDEAHAGEVRLATGESPAPGPQLAGGSWRSSAP